MNTGPLPECRLPESTQRKKKAWPATQAAKLLAGLDGPDGRTRRLHQASTLSRRPTPLPDPSRLPTRCKDSVNANLCPGKMMLPEKKYPEAPSRAHVTLPTPRHARSQHQAAMLVTIWLTHPHPRASEQTQKKDWLVVNVTLTSAQVTTGPPHARLTPS